jgi:chromosome segregation ATPase
MANEPISDEPTVEIAQRPEPQKPRGRALLVIFALVSFVGCAVLGALLHQAHEREGALSAALSASEYERSEAQVNLERTRNTLDAVKLERDDALRKLDATRVALQEATNDRDDARSALERSEAGRTMAESSLSSTRGSLRTVTTERDELRATLRQSELARDAATRALTTARAEVSECNEALEQVTSIARSHRDKLDEIASAIRIGMIGVADIPAKGFVFTGGYDLESEYRKVVDEYNDLVRRFNAAVDRSNDLGEVLNQIIRILR